MIPQRISMKGFLSYRDEQALERRAFHFAELQAAATVLRELAD